MARPIVLPDPPPSDGVVTLRPWDQGDVPASALRESVAPIVFLRWPTAASRESAATRTGPSVMNRTSAS